MPDYGKDNNLNLKTIITVGRMHNALWSRLAKSIASTGLTMGQFGVLEALYHKGPLTVNQVIGKTLSSSGNMAVVIENLIKNGMVVKETDSRDRRIRILKITGKGEKLIRGFFPEHLYAIEDSLSVLSEEEKEQLSRISRKLGLSLQEK